MRSAVAPLLLGLCACGAPLAASDPRTMAGWTKQAPPPGYAPIPDDAKKPFPGRPFAEVRAYTLRLDGGRLLAAGNLVAADGTLGATVNVPGKRLTPADVERLLAIVPELRGEARPNALRPTVGCPTAAHHGFVFYDDSGRPVGEIEVSLACGTITHRPAVAALGGELFDEERAAFRALCKELGLAECDDRAALPPAVSCEPPVTGRMNALTGEEKSRLCFWYAEEAAALGRKPPDLVGEHGFACPDGEKGTFTGTLHDECVATFPTCDATVAEVATCVRHRLKTTLCPTRTADDPCARVNACTWGVRRTLTP